MPGATPATGATEEHPLRRKTAGFRGVAPGTTGGAIRAARSCRYARSGQQARGRSGAAALPARCDSGCNRGPVSESHAGAAHRGCTGRRWRPRLRPGLFAAARRFPRRLYQRSDPVAAPSRRRRGSARAACDSKGNATTSRSTTLSMDFRPSACRGNARITVVGKINRKTEKPYQFWGREDVRTCARIRRKVGLPR